MALRASFSSAAAFFSAVFEFLTDFFDSERLSSASNLAFSAPPLSRSKTSSSLFARSMICLWSPMRSPAVSSSISRSLI